MLEVYSAIEIANAGTGTSAFGANFTGLYLITLQAVFLEYPV